MHVLKTGKALLLGLSVVVLALVLACGEEATPTAIPTTTPTAAPVDVSSLVQQAVASMPTPAPGVSTEDIPSMEEIASLVQTAIAASVPEGTSAEQIQQMVQAAVAAASAPGISREDVEQAVAAAVSRAVGEAVAQITPVATPVSTPTPTAPAMVTPTGTLDIGVPPMDPPVFVLKNQGFRQSKFDHLVTHETLWTTLDDGNAGPRLIKEWSADDTGLVYTFKLQEGVKWNDLKGRDWGNLTVDDIIFSLNAVTEEGTIHSAAGKMRENFFCDGCSFSKVDDLTMQVVQPRPTFQITWFNKTPGAALAIHSKKHFDAVGEEQANRESVGTGPWVLTDFQTDQFRKVRAVEDHWRKTPEWAEMVWWEIAEESTRLANFITGSVDTASLNFQSLQAIKQEGIPFKTITFFGTTVQHMLLLSQQYYPDAPAHSGESPTVPLGEGASYTEACKTLPWVSCDRDFTSAEWARARKVREAMNLAIDRQKLVNNLVFGQGSPWFITLWSSDTHAARRAQFGLDKLEWPYDPVRAKQLLTEAGIPDGFEIDVALSRGDPEGAMAVAPMWEEVGIRAKLNNTPYSAFRPGLVSRAAKGIMTNAYTPGLPEPLTRYLIFYRSGNTFNFGFEHPWFEEKLAEALVTFDDEERWALQAEIAQWVFDEILTLPLYSQDTVWPLGPELDPWKVMPQAEEFLCCYEDAPHRQ